jgi:hypothetical protein
MAPPVLVFLASLSLHDPPPTINEDPLPDTSRTNGTTMARQESVRVQPAQEPFGGGVSQHNETILDRTLDDKLDAARHGAMIDSLLNAYPGLKGLVLRTLLMPKPLPEFYTSSPTPGNRVAGNYRMTRFERNSMIKARAMELRDRWTEARILAPRVDLLGIVLSFLELLR